MFDKQQKILLKDKLKDIKYKPLHKEILNILQNDSNFKYSTNINGPYFDINKLNDDTLNDINKLLNKVQNAKINDKLEYNSYFKPTPNHLWRDERSKYSKETFGPTSNPKGFDEQYDNNKLNKIVKRLNI